VKRWNIKAEYNADKNIVAQLLQLRGLTDEKQVQEFLHPLKLSELFKEFPAEFKKSLIDAKRVVEDAIAKDYTIVIHGDYDADGITSTAILFNALSKELGYAKTRFFIPNRFDHGYGVSKKSLDSIMAKYPGEKILFITVDSGITAAEEAEYIKKLGHKLIITDHHHKPDVLPQAEAIVWNDTLVGATVAWIFSRALGAKDPQSIALAALATITDLQPVIGFNRTIVKRGLEVINTDPPLGMKELLELARKKDGEVTAYDLGWIIGPRLNASGRLVDASETVELFTETNPAKIKEIALKLHELNTNRQDKTVEMYALTSDYTPENLPKIIISENEEYHEGIIGLVAARLVQKYYRPAIVISLNGDRGKGSARSINGVNIIEILHGYEDLFVSLGGHPMAAGFTIETAKIPLLKERLFGYAQANISEELLIPELFIDLKIPIDVVSVELMDELDKMKPFGLGNEEPLFMSEQVGVIDMSSVGKENQHTVIKFFSNGKYYKGIYFNSAEDQRVKELKVGDKMNVTYGIKKNTFNGRTYVDMLIKDFSPASTIKN